MTDTNTNDGEQELTASEMGRGMRLMLSQALGDQVSPTDDDDAYDVFNWDPNPTVWKYYATYLRNPYARAVVDKPVDTAWREPPEVTDEADTLPEETTEFEDGLADLVDDHRLWHYGKRADRLAGIGEYGVLVLEFNDITDPEEFKHPVGDVDGPEPLGGLQLEGLRPFSEESVEEIETGDPGGGRWGEPVLYELDLSDENDVETEAGAGGDVVEVHHSRVVHIPSDGLLDDEIRGTPRQEPVFNALVDIEKTLGSAAEVAYRASSYGLNVNLDKDYQLEDGGEDLDNRLRRWYHGLEPMLQTQGAEVQNLGGEQIDPTPVLDAEIQAIAAETGIPQSVLKGNETGERASSEDLKEWYGQVAERREQIVTPVIVRSLIDALREHGVLPEPEGGGYDVEWPPLAEESAKDVAETQQVRSKVVKNIKNAVPGLSGSAILEYIEEGEFPDDAAQEEDNEMEPADAEQLLRNGGEDPGEKDAEQMLREDGESGGGDMPPEFESSAMSGG